MAAKCKICSFLDPQSENHSERIREVAYKLYHTATHQQEQILQHLLERRRQLAEICGYSSYAQRATLESLAQDPETVNSFLAQLSTSLKPRMAEDFQAMLGLKRKSPVGGSASDLEVWDLAHLSNMFAALIGEIVEDWRAKSNTARMFTC